MQTHKTLQTNHHWPLVHGGRVSQAWPGTSLASDYQRTKEGTDFVMLLNFLLPTLFRQLLARNLELQVVAQLHRDAVFGCDQLLDALE